MVRLLTTSEVADRLGCSTRTVMRRIEDGQIAAFRDGRLVRVAEDALGEYIAANTKPRTMAEAVAAVGIPTRRRRRRPAG